VALQGRRAPEGRHGVQEALAQLQLPQHRPLLGVDHGVALADGLHVKGNALPVRPELIPRPGGRLQVKGGELPFQVGDLRVEVLEDDGILEGDVVQGLLCPLQEHRGCRGSEEVLGGHPLQGPPAVRARAWLELADFLGYADFGALCLQLLAIQNILICHDDTLQALLGQKELQLGLVGLQVFGDLLRQSFKVHFGEAGVHGQDGYLPKPLNHLVVSRAEDLHRFGRGLLHGPCCQEHIIQLATAGAVRRLSCLQVRDVPAPQVREVLELLKQILHRHGQALELIDEVLKSGLPDSCGYVVDLVLNDLQLLDNRQEGVHLALLALVELLELPAALPRQIFDPVVHSFDTFQRGIQLSLHMHQFLVNRVEAVSHLLLDGFAVGIQLVLHLIKTFGDCVLEIGEALLHLLLDRPLAVGHCILDLRSGFINLLPGSAQNR